MSGFWKDLPGSLSRFFRSEALIGVILLLSSGLALYASNSSFAPLYKSLTHFPLFLDFGIYSIKTTLHHIINDGLMSVFFFVVGMEVKRELLHGELAAPRKAALSFLAACGGMLLPAGIYWAFNHNLPSAAGWGIPMATDIAFAVGILSLLSHKVPFGLKIFLLSLAIIDDIGAVLVIALFYSQNLSGPFLALSCFTAFCIFIYFKLGLRSHLILFLLALGLWVCVFNSGIHATLSGVLLGFLIPGNRRITGKQAAEAVSRVFRSSKPSAKKVRDLSANIKEAHPPLDRFISLFYPFVGYIIMPLFAFFNAGLPLEQIAVPDLFSQPVALGIFAGLFIGKPVGVVLFAWLATLTGAAQLPQNVSWRHIVAVGFLAGIGFTMSLFISNLSFSLSDPYALLAKISILSASLLGAFTGLLLLFFTKTVPKSQRKAPTS